MSLSVYLEEVKPTEVYWRNITHNLTEMAGHADLYDALWHPENINARLAKHLIFHLKKGLEKLEANPEFFQRFNPKNGWGSYGGFVEFVRDYLRACEENPEAIIRVDG